MKMKKKLLGFSIVVIMLLSIPLVAVGQSPENVPSKVDQKILDKEMEELEKVSSGDYIIDVETGLITPYFASGGPEISHQWLGAHTITILDNDNKTGALIELLRNKSSFLAGCDWPDTEENYTGTYLGHFGTDKNYLGDVSPTALTRFNYWMGQATKYYNSSNSDNAYGIKCLGIAFHYFSDLNAPHHAGNIPQTLTSNHVAWEEYADQNKDSFVATNAGSFYNKYKLNFNMYAANGSASYALTQVDNAANTEIGSTKSRSAAYNTYRRCQQNGAALLDAFFRSEGVS